MESESSVFLDDLAKLNQRGVLTVNSQPNVNGLPSSHPIHGWGNPGGYIYKKVFYWGNQTNKILLTTVVLYCEKKRSNIIMGCCCILLRQSN